MDRVIRYTVHFEVDRGVWTPSEWRIRSRGQRPGFGAPNAANLRKHCLKVEQSTLAGGVNRHLGPTKIQQAWIVDHDQDKIVARVGGPLLEAR